MGKETLQIIDEIKLLPLEEKLYIIELIFRDIRNGTTKRNIEEEEKRREAAEILLADYQNDEGLISFTALDKEDFYEAN